MAAKTYTKVAGAWRELKDVFVKSSGAWSPSKKVWVKVAGAWQGAFEPSIVVNVTANTDSFNLFTAAGSPLVR